MEALRNIDPQEKSQLTHLGDFQKYAEQLHEQLLESGLTLPVKLIVGLSLGNQTIPGALLMGDRVILMDVSDSESNAVRAAKCDKLTVAARRFSLFHRASEGKKIHCILLTDASKEAPYPHFQCQVAPWQKLGAYLRSIAPQSVRFDFAEWLAETPRDGADMLRDRIDKSLARWSKFLLDGWIQDAAEELEKLFKMGYRVYQTSSYQAAKDYCFARYGGTDAVYGFATSSEAENMLIYGASKGPGKVSRIPTPQDEGWEERWFDNSSPDAGRTFKRAIYEHQLKDKRIDFEVLGWGDDMRWVGKWKTKKSGLGSLSLDFGMNLALNGRHRPKVSDRGGQLVEEQPNYRLGAYNVFLNAPKDGLIFFTISDMYIDTVKNALLRAGAKGCF